MGQRRGAPAAKFLFTAMILVGCGKPAAPPTTASTTRTVASLVPAATDLIIGMGAADRLVGVSSYDRQRPDVGNIPEVGDYQTVDWEKLQELRPAVMVIQIGVDRVPAGFSQRADDLHIELLDIGIDRLDDIYSALDTLGNALNAAPLAKAAQQTMQTRLDAVRRSAAGKEPVSALIVLDESAQSVAGPDTYLDDLLKLAGGANAAGKLNRRYPQIDREMLVSLRPQVIIQLLPGASPQAKQQASAFWARVPQIPAVQNGRVCTIDNWYALLPGWHVTDLAEKFEQCLHPSTQP